MIQSIFTFCLMIIVPIATIYVIRKLWNCIFKPSRPTLSDWRSGWEKYIWENNKPIREATYDEWDHQCCTGSPIKNKNLRGE